MLSRSVTTVGIAGVATVWLSSMAVAQTPLPRTVLTIHWGSEDFPGTSVTDAAIREALQSREDAPIDYFAEYWESEAFSSESSTLAFRDYIRRKFEGRRIDVVIANATPALQFALRYREELFPLVPVVFLAGGIPEVTAQQKVTGITGVVSDAALSETLELALKLHPDVKRVFVVAQAPTVEGYSDRIRAALTPFSGRVELIYTRQSSLSSLLAAVKAISPPGLILYARYTPADSEAVIYSDEVVRDMARVSAVPIYGVTDLYLGSGVVGGMMRSSRATGTRIGHLARQILDGTPPETIPIERVPVAPTFDWRQLERWGIDISRIPPGSDMRFRVPSVWESYRWYILGTLFVIAAQLTLIAGLLTQITRRRGAEATIRTREATLRTSYERIRHLAGRLINAQESARAGIARDLHDDFCQRLVYVSMAVSGLKNASGDIQASGTQQAFSDLEQDTNGLFDGIRRLSHELHPATLHLLGLPPTLEAHCAEVEKRHAVHVRFKTEGDLGRLHPDLALCLFRIAQESLRNGVEHGRARHFDISLARSGEHVELTITDDGTGFDLDAARRNGSGLGLVSMEERANLVGGEVHIVSEVGRGTTVRVRGSAEPPQPIRLPRPGEPTDLTPIEHSPAAG
jgi:signal transduction histidine kinase